MKSWLKNWKTTLTGVATLLGGVADILMYAAKGALSPHIDADLTAISAGIGLIFAKDGNVTGGTTTQP